MKERQTIHGGSWLTGSRSVFSATRTWVRADFRTNLVGFRFIIKPKEIRVINEQELKKRNKLPK